MNSTDEDYNLKMKESIELILADYVDFILKYKEVLKSYNQNEADLIRMKKGDIGGYKFFYHGTGCRLEKDSVVCEFDSLPKNDFHIKFSNWKMYEFINSTTKWGKFNYTLEDVHEALLQLVKQGKLVFLVIGGASFPIFQVKLLSGSSSLSIEKSI